MKSIHYNNQEYTLHPEQWDDMIEEGNCLLVDTRNDYEVEMGSFNGAINPHTQSFRNFPEWVDNIESTISKESSNILMFCTGGIRCEKSTSYMKNRGFKNVYQLHGGILNYLEKTNNKRNNWHGECFVFDDRIAVDQNMKPVTDVKCFKCDKLASLKDIRNSSKGKVLCEECNY